MNPYLLHVTKHPPHDCWFLKVFSSLDCLAVHFSYPILIRASFTYLLRIRRILQISRNIPHAYVLLVLSFKNYSCKHNIISDLFKLHTLKSKTKLYSNMKK